MHKFFAERVGNMNHDDTEIHVVDTDPAGLDLRTVLTNTHLRAQIAVIVGPDRGRTHTLEGTAAIGRHAEANIHLSPSSVSRKHAMIGTDPEGRYFILDLNSQNGVRVNGHRIKERTLVFGDRIEIGPDAALLFTAADDIGERLRESQRLESLGSLAGSVAHDFNNLLGVVLANLQFLSENLDRSSLAEPSINESLSDSLDALKRAGDLTKQLKTFARCGPWSAQPFDLADVVQDVNRLVRRTFDARVEVELELERGLRVEGDPTQTHQVVMNLCVNARDAMPDGGKLCLSLKRVKDQDPLPSELDPTKPHLVLSIADSGAGIEPANIPRIFEPFFTTKGGAGTGLGLAIVYGIIRRLRGVITLRSEVGVGTEFSIYLPLAE
jgi:signal transduction histidine kinase